MEPQEAILWRVKFWIAWVALKLKGDHRLSKIDIILKELNVPVKPIKSRKVRVVQWNFPLRGCYKLNTDGYCLDLGVSGAGGG